MCRLNEMVELRWIHLNKVYSGIKEIFSLNKFDNAHRNSEKTFTGVHVQMYVLESLSFKYTANGKRQI